MTPTLAPQLVAAGRYAIFHAGRECGEERWRIEVAREGLLALGEQRVESPHPFPNAQEYRVSLTDALRPTGFEVLWSVGARRLRAVHAASGGKWRVRIEVAEQVREQEGDFPEPCEVEFMTHLSSLFVLSRRDFQVGGEHEFPVLRIGPPFMAVTPDRMLYRCVERGSFAGPLGAVAAKRYEVSLPAHGAEQGYTFWADEHDTVLESYEGHDASRPWMRLVELRRGNT